MNDLIKNFTYISNDMENNDIQERINALESRRLELLTRASKSDRAALDYVKSLPGFREAYPEFAADAEQVAAAEQEVVGTLAEVKAEWRLHIGEAVEPGAVIVHDGIRYTVLQAHTLQEDWEPGSVPALYKREGVDGEPADEWPEWVQPTGAHDVYAAGAKVTFGGKHYISLIDNNSWSPAAYPAGWDIQG